MKNAPDINSKQYWDHRFKTNWDELGGAEQTRFFAKVIAEHLPPWFIADAIRNRLSFCDWGCAEGEAVEYLGRIFRENKLTGIDFAAAAIEKANRKYPGHEFISADWLANAETELPDYDIVMTSNVLEHFPDPIGIVRNVLGRVATKYIVMLVPYAEDQNNMEPEHAFRFTKANLPFCWGEWMCCYFEIVGTKELDNSGWSGQQALAIYIHESWMREAHTDLTLENIPAESNLLAQRLDALNYVKELMNRASMDLEQALQPLRDENQGLRENLAMAQQALAEQKKAFEGKLVDLTDYAKATAEQRDEIMKADAVARQQLADARAEIDPLRFEAQGLRENLSMIQQALVEQKKAAEDRVMIFSDYAQAAATQREEAMKAEAAARQQLADTKAELDPLRFEVQGLRENLAMIQQALVEQKKAAEDRVMIFSDYAQAAATQRDEAIRAEAAARQEAARLQQEIDDLKEQLLTLSHYHGSVEDLEYLEKNNDTMAELLAEKIQQRQKDFDRIDELEKRVAAAERLRDEIERQVQELGHKYEELYLQNIALENAQREATREIGEARLEAAHAREIISKFNHALSYCQNRSWELMTKLEAHLKTRDYIVGKYYGLLARDKKRSAGVLMRWVAARLMRRPFSLAQELGATYPLHEAEGGLKALAFFARDAGRETSSIAVVTPTSMADHSFPLSRYQSPDLIVYSITSWSFREQRPQHLVRGLVKRHCRAFVMPTDTIGLKEEFPTDAHIAEKMVVRRLEDDIWEVVPCSFNTLNIYKDNLSDPRDVIILKRSLALLREKFGIGNHVGLVQLPFWGPLALSLPGGRVVYDCMDNHSDFSTNAEGMLSQEDRLLRDADAVLVSSRYLERAAGDKPRAKYLVRNACEYDYFSRPPEAIAPAMAELDGPVIGYYGAISDWFDSKLVTELARRRPDWQFILIGHTFGADIDELKKLPNVTMPGEVKYRTLTAFLYRFDVCIIPFKLTELIKATNPVKIYEYSAAGKPTVATRIPELEELGNLVDLADDAAGFEKAIEARLADADKEQRAERLKAFARENTWAKRVDNLALAIREHAWPRVSVVVLSYGEWSVTRDCLDSILNETTYPNFEVIVIDNASGEETRKALGQINDPRLKVVFNEANRGYAGGNNQGMRLADGDYIVLLNNDTVCPPDWIQDLVGVFKEDPKIGLAGPMTNSAGNEQMLDVTCTYGQDQFLWLQEFRRVRRGRRHTSDRLGFFCVALRREAYETIGDLDEAFGIGYFEDDDYCARALEAGWKLAVVEDAFVFHKGSVSFKALDDAKKQAIFEKNRVLFEKKHSRPWTNPICERMWFEDEDKANAAQPVALMAPGCDWNAPHGRPQQIALGLVRSGWRVYYVTDNQSADHFLGIRLLRPGLYMIENRPAWIEEALGKKIDLYYSFGEPGEALRARVNAAVQAVDFDANPLRAPWQWDPESEPARKAADEADLITLSGDGADIPGTWREKALTLPTGIDLEDSAGREPLLPPEDLKPIVNNAGGPVIAIVCPIDDSVDWQWLEPIVHAMHAITFVHIQTNPTAPKRADWPAVFNLRNMHALGYIPYGRRADYLAFMTAVLIPRSPQPDTQTCCARPVLEALAMGKPVISGQTFGRPGLEPCVIPVSVPEQMDPAIHEALRRAADADYGQACRGAIASSDNASNMAKLTKKLAGRKKM